MHLIYDKQGSIDLLISSNGCVRIKGWGYVLLLYLLGKKQQDNLMETKSSIMIWSINSNSEGQLDMSNTRFRIE